MGTVTISQKEYCKLKSLENIQWELVSEFKESLQDFQEGRFKKH